MNYLPIILLVLFFVLQKNKNQENLFSSLPLQELTGLLPMLGLDEKTVESIQMLIPALTAEKIDLRSVITNAMPLIAAFMSKNKAQASPQSKGNLNDVDGVACEEIFSSLNSYFS
ncbi:MAG: hypothetical protein IJW13_02360 [Clostridia bacterium]|nr:hypothetical protein [Clostridia bacterium]